MGLFTSRMVFSAFALSAVVCLAMLSHLASASGAPPCGACDCPNHPLHWHHAGPCSSPWGCYGYDGAMDGTWYWMRTPEQEKRVVMNLYNRYCVRCHGVDGRGVWDIPDVPDFTNVVWQTSRSDDQLARLTIEGRGAVMPAFRGTLTLEEAWGIARYLRTFVPGTEVSPPDEGSSPTPARPMASSATSSAKKADRRSTVPSQSQVQSASAKVRLRTAP